MGIENDEKDQRLMKWKGAHRTLKTMDLASLRELESNLIDSLQNVKKVIVKREEDESECRICRDRKKDTVLVPCGHCLCSQCCQKVQKCPMCRARIERSIKIR